MLNGKRNELFIILSVTIVNHNLDNRTDAHLGIARMQYGNAVQRMVGDQVSSSPILRNLFQYVANPNSPDFIGRGLFTGLHFDITTNTSRSIVEHTARSYGEGLILLLYNRYPKFTVFP